MDYPLGWLLRTKQYSRRTSEMYDTFEQQFSHLRGAAMHFTAFGNFDRIEFVPVEQFGEYQDGVPISFRGRWSAVSLYILWFILPVRPECRFWTTGNFCV